MKKLLFQINVLHFLNDGLKVCLVLLLPFIAKDLTIPLSQVGLLGSTINTVQILASIPGAFVASRIGGIKTMLFAMLIYGIAFLVTGFSSSLFLAGISFVIGGIGFSVLHPLGFALITKLAPSEERGKLVGNFTAVGDIGILALTPTIPFLAAKIGWRETAIFYGIFICLFFFFFYFFYKPQKDIKEPVEEELEPLEIPLRKNFHFLLSIFCSFLDATVSSPIYIFIPFLFLFRGVSPTFLGIFTGSFFIGSLIGKTVIGRITDKVGNINTFIFAEYCMAALLILLSFVNSLPVIFTLSLFVGIFTRGTAPAVKTIVYDTIGSAKKVQKAFTVENVLNGIGAALGPLLLGFISQRFGITSAFLYGGMLAAIATTPAILISFQKRKNK